MTDRSPTVETERVIKGIIRQGWDIAGGRIEVILYTPDPAADAHYRLMHDVAKAIELWDAAHDRSEA